MKEVNVWTSQDGVSPMSATVLRNWLGDMPVDTSKLVVSDDCHITGPSDVIEPVCRRLSGCLITDVRGE
jgi:hypothetical protein